MSGDDQPHVRYLIVVHGIGDQKLHETVLPFINQLGERRRAQAAGKPASERPSGEPPVVALRGAVMSQTGPVPQGRALYTADEYQDTRPWIEFDSIPKELTVKELEPWQGLLPPPEQLGANLRFAEVYWADTAHEDWTLAGDSTAHWAEALSHRLRQARHPAPPPVRKLMEVLTGTLVTTERLLGVRNPHLREVIFDRYIGDVQLYGEHALTRGKLIRRFHEQLARIEHWHEHDELERMQRDPAHQYREARYTIVSHSLGTVVSFDALLLAAAAPKVRASPLARPRDWPPAGYRPPELLPLEHAVTQYEVQHQAFLQAPQAERWDALKPLREAIRHLGTDWLDRVDRFITLGSPLDKFLILWPQNYYWLENPADWLDKDRDRSDQRLIFHENYCDEQDPVGDQLRVVQTTAAYQRLFHLRDNHLYLWEPLPGVAHIKYHACPPLGERILDEDPERTKERPPDAAWHRRGGYAKLLLLSYLLWPALFVLVTAWAYVRYLSLDPTSGYPYWWGTATSLLAVVLAGFYVRRFTELTLWWRMILSQVQRQSAFSAARGRLARWLRLALVNIPLSAAIVAALAMIQVVPSRPEARAVQTGWLAMGVALLLFGLTLRAEIYHPEIPREMRPRRWKRLWERDGWVLFLFLLGALVFVCFQGVEEGQVIPAFIATSVLAAVIPLSMLLLGVLQPLPAAERKKEQPLRFEAALEATTRHSLLLWGASLAVVWLVMVLLPLLNVQLGSRTWDSGIWTGVALLSSATAAAFGWSWTLYWNVRRWLREHPFEAAPPLPAAAPIPRSGESDALAAAKEPARLDAGASPPIAGTAAAVSREAVPAGESPPLALALEEQLVALVQKVAQLREPEESERFQGFAQYAQNFVVADEAQEGNEKPAAGE